MAVLTRWVLAGVSAASLVACSRSSTSPSTPVVETRRVAIDFEALPSPSPPTDGMVWRGCTYTEDGFTLETLSGNCAIAGGFISVHMPPDPMGPDAVNRFIGSVSFSNGVWYGVARLTRASGGTFTLVSIDLDAFNPLSVLVPGGPVDASQPQTVTFTGTRPDGTTVTQAFTTDTVFPRGETFVFRADFNDVARVEWSQLGPPFHQFDNIVVSSR